MVGGGSTTDGDWHFFISYTQADRAWAEWIAWQLEEDRYRVLIQAWDMVPGSDWTHLMHEGVQRASRMIAVLSGAYLESVFGTAEWEAAWRGDPLGEQRKLLVFRVADCERPGLLAGLVSTDLSGLDKTAARARVKAAARSAVTGRAKPETEPTFPPAARAARTEPRFPGSLPEVWNVPPRNPNFTGRTADLVRIRDLLAGHPAVTVHALHGMGGVGKSQTAIEYAHRNADDYDLVWWVDAEQAAIIGDQFARLGEEVGLPPLADPAAIVDAVRRALRARERWLLIFDNAEDWQQVRALLPGGSGHVLVTTRRGGFRSLGGVVDLDVLDRAEAVALLRRRVPGLASDQAGLLARRLGDLPLALDQAAAYLDETGMSPRQYLDLLGSRSADLHSRGRSSGHPDTVATVWSLSLDRLQAATPAAVQLLQLCAWLAPEPIPLDLFTGHRDLLPEPLATAAGDPVAFNDAAGALTGYSLARRVDGTLIVHRLIQEITRHRLSSQPQAMASDSLETVLGLLNADLPGQVWATPGSWPRWRAMLPSVLAATGHQASTTGNGPTAWLLARAGTYLRSQGRPAEALPLHQRALHIHEATYGPDHPDVATDLNYVGRVLSDLGRSAEALPLQERALHIHEATYGPDHPDVATDLNYVGQGLSDLGRPAEALPLHQRALRIRKATYGPDHPNVATDLNYVGQALSALGRPAEALPLQERALHIDEATYGPDHPDVAYDLNYVGQALSDLGRSAEALPLQERALHIDEATYGSGHPDVAAALNNVGRALSDLGRPAEALPLHQRALRIHEATYGPDHPDVAAALNNVGRALSDLGRSAEALPLHQRALRIHEATNGPDHPDVAAALNNMGRALSDPGHRAETVPLQERALRNWTTVMAAGSEKPRRLIPVWIEDTEGSQLPDMLPFLQPILVSRMPGSGRPEVWHVPSRNPDFTGREGKIVLLRETLMRSPRTMVVLQGLGGIGKTQLTIEYAHRFAADYDMIWFFDAEQPELIEGQFAQLAGALHVTADAQDAVPAVLTALRDRQRWLLVFDNVEDSDHISGFLPDGQGHVLATSRVGAWQEIGTPITVEEFSRAESTAMLTAKVPALALADADGVAEDLGDFPLALAQAVGILQELPASEFRRLLGGYATQVLSEGRPRSYRAAHAATIVALDKLNASHPKAATLVRLCSYLASESVPAAWFAEFGRRDLPPAITRSALPEGTWEVGKAFMRIRDIGLGTVDQRGLRLHRPTQAIVRDHTAADRDAYRDVVITILVGAAPRDSDDPASWPDWSRLIPHLMVVGQQETPDEFRPVACAAARYLLVSGQARAGLTLAQRLYEAWTAELGPDHLDTLTIAQHLVHATHDSGEYGRLLEFQQDILTRRRKLLGEDHPDTLRSASDLAVILSATGRQRDALTIAQDLYDRRSRVLGEDHPDTLTSARHLAGTLGHLGRHAEALALNQGAHDRSRRILGDDHPDTLRSVDSLASTLGALGRHAEALTLRQDAYQRSRQVLGDDHPDILRFANNLASTLGALGRHAEALTLSQDAYERGRRVLGENHPDTLRSGISLATTLYRMGRRAEALALNQDVYTRSRRVLGDDHPDTLRFARNLAAILAGVGQRSAALRLLGKEKPRKRKKR